MSTNRAADQNGLWYVEGDDCRLWQNVASMIDIVRSDGARVFLVRRLNGKLGKTFTFEL